MAIRIGINGFGRIGRSIVRAAYQAKFNDIEIVHINDLVDTSTCAHLLQYDSVHGVWPKKVSAVNQGLNIDGQIITTSSIRSPAELPWREKKIDIVLECTGLFTKGSDATRHLDAGARKVLISAPATGVDLTLVYGVNEEKLLPEHRIVSNGSCTTNCLAPVAKIIHEHCGIDSALMTTIHSYTNDQQVLDLAHKDLRRARAAALNMIPTSTGAAQAIGLVLPELQGKFDGLAVRVPTPNVSLVDVSINLSRPTSTDAVNACLQSAAEGNLRGILAFSEAPLVSGDFNGTPFSSIVDGPMTKMIGNRFLKVLSWYDNETGFSNRMLDVAKLMGTPSARS
jgi:glyceraldehyde 3-phosphate dehydrogenase